MYTKAFRPYLMNGRKTFDKAMGKWKWLLISNQPLIETYISVAQQCSLTSSVDKIQKEAMNNCEDSNPNLIQQHGLTCIAG